MTDLYLEPEGFLGNGASLLADLTLFGYIFLIVPAMIIGLIFARRGMHRPQHKYTMIAITTINWILIILLMLVAYDFDIADNISDQPGNSRYLIPTIHGLLGLPAQLLATYIIIRMLLEDNRVAAAKKRGETDLEKYWFKNAKWMMRLTLGLWFATATLGIVTYLVRYEFVDGFNLDEDTSGEVAPVATEDIPAPEATDEPDTIEVTEDAPSPEATDDTNVPEMTDEPEPAITEEAQDIPEPDTTEEPEDIDDPSATEEASP